MPRRLAVRPRFMPQTLSTLLAFALAIAAGVAPARAVDTHDTRMLRHPAISADHVAFVYDQDIWIANRDGSGARRLTTAEGEEINPVFSPDGSQIAFTGNYDGNLDVYLIDTTGGPVTRLTWHPETDLVREFTPDGGAVLFESWRKLHTRRYRDLHTVPVTGGMPTRLPIPTAIKAALSPDGGKIAYTPLGEPFDQWKHYRGGRQSRIWIMEFADLSVEEIPKPDGGSNDTDPNWIGDTVYFTSDRDGEFNLYAYRPGSGAVERLTDDEDFPAIDARAGDGVLIFERAGRLHIYDPASGSTTTLRIGVGADLRERRARWTSGEEWVRAASVSPGGKRVALEFRGEIVTVPAEKGDPRNLTDSVGAHDRAPAWSPDGRSIAYVSDQGGEYGLMIAAQDGAGEARRIEIPGAGFYSQLAWSPDSASIALLDNSLTIWVVDVASGEATHVAQEPVYTPVVTTSYSWSPDSRWLAYTLARAGMMQTGPSIICLPRTPSCRIGHGAWRRRRCHRRQARSLP